METTEPPPPDLDRLRESVHRGDAEALSAALESLPGADLALVVSRLSEDEQTRLFELLGPDRAAGIIAGFGFAQLVRVVENMPHQQAADVIDRFPSDLQADVLNEFSREQQDSVIAEMAAEEAADARMLLRYPEDSAGGLMVREFLAYRVDQTAEDVRRDLRENRERYTGYDVQYAYVTDSRGRLGGVLRMRDLLLAPVDAPLLELMIPEPLSVPADLHLREINALFSDHGFLGLPVVESEGRLVGLIQRSHVEEANLEEATGNFLKLSGLLGEDELRTMPLRLRAGRRLMWLSINIVLNLIAASVIAANQDVLAQVIALAVFLPIISDMSGCSGNQAVGVSIRELSLNLVRPNEFLRVVLKESAVGLVNGAALGLMIGAIAGAWQQNFAFGAVVGGALFLNTVVAVCLGGLIPLALRSLRMDPALASAPILTTVTDMCGFFLVLSLAGATLPHLT